jgi:hypothetical protein
MFSMGGVLASSFRNVDALVSQTQNLTSMLPGEPHESQAAERQSTLEFNVLVVLLFVEYTDRVKKASPLR